MSGADGYLIDVSAIGRMMRPDVIDAWREPLTSGRIGICELTALDLLRSARSGEEYARVRAGLEAAYTWWPIPDSVWSDARTAQGRLQQAGTHRSAGLAPLLLTATARHHGLTLLHYDREVDAVGRAAGQPVQWLAEPGSID
ncbi:putative nucleic acid-binding protein [Streptacidiphilus sp. MAP12-33]|uniref:PIN domain-containing protein n=1 Tax=Streptacidiphilus sp. MAP12-33 TaxID=3156266 RepID=UPI003515909F